jgi:hypothetical protein
MFLIDEVDTHELLPIEELANKFLWKIAREKFSEYAHACMYTQKHASWKSYTLRCWQTDNPEFPTVKLL